MSVCVCLNGAAPAAHRSPHESTKTVFFLLPYHYCLKAQLTTPRCLCGPKSICLQVLQGTGCRLIFSLRWGECLCHMHTLVFRLFLNRQRRVACMLKVLLPKGMDECIQAGADGTNCCSSSCNFSKSSGLYWSCSILWGLNARSAFIVWK